MAANKSKSSKKNTSQKLAPIGLWLSLAGFLSLVILLVLKLIIFMGMYTPPTTKYINLALWISIGVLVVGPALYALLAPNRVRDFLTGQKARHGSNAIILLIAFVLILFVVNLIVFQNPYEWDWTEEQSHTLAPETLNALAAIPSQVHAIGFYPSRSTNPADQELLTQYADHSDGKFDYEILDPEQNPLLAQQYGVTGDATVVLLLEDRHETLTYLTEQTLTSALVRLMNPGERAVYFLTGHGERSIDSSEDTEFSSAVSVLEAKNYTIQTLNLQADQTIPADALAIILAGPTEPITAQEMTLLADYLNGGGAVILLTEPTFTAEDTDPLVQFMAANWGILLDPDVIIDTSSSQTAIAWSSAYASHPITENLAGTNTFFPVARSLFTNGSLADVEVTPLIQGSDAAWGETDFASIQNNQISFDSAADIPGPLLLAAAAENSLTGGRVVVICDSDFASNLFFDQYGNGDLFINTVDWSAGQESMLTLTVKPAVERQMSALNNTTLLLMAFSFVCLIPGLILGAGVTAWLMRRARG